MDHAFAVDDHPNAGRERQQANGQRDEAGGAEAPSRAAPCRRQSGPGQNAEATERAEQGAAQEFGQVARLGADQEPIALGVSTKVGDLDVLIF